MYKIIGSDGKTYGPVDAAQIRAWIAQGRADARTAAIAEGAGEWTFLGLLPEFAHELAGTPPSVIVPLKPVASSATGTNGFAIVGFVCGLLSLPLFLCCCGCPLNVLGVIFSSIALMQINAQVQKQPGWGLALAGLICAIVSLLMSVALILLQFVPTAASVGIHSSGM